MTIVNITFTVASLFVLLCVIESKLASRHEDPIFMIIATITTDIIMDSIDSGIIDQ
jgi:hypothetical protein